MHIKLKGRGYYRLDYALFDSLVSPWHVGMLKQTGIAMHMTTIATAKHIYRISTIPDIKILILLVTLIILIQQSVNDSYYMTKG